MGFLVSSIPAVGASCPEVFDDRPGRYPRADRFPLPQLLPRPDSVEQASADGTNLVLKKKGDNDARLLVRVLQAEGLVAGPQLLSHPKDHLFLDEKMTPVVVQAEAVNPRFKILLFPFRASGPMPTVKWIDQPHAVEIVTATERRVVTFADTSDGKTRVSVTE